jgi:hypothetical protein
MAVPSKSAPEKSRRLATQQSIDACHRWTGLVAAMGFPCDSFFRDKFFEWAADDGNEDNSRVIRLLAATECLVEDMGRASIDQEKTINLSKGLYSTYN